MGKKGGPKEQLRSSLQGLSSTLQASTRDHLLKFYSAWALEGQEARQAGGQLKGFVGAVRKSRGAPRVLAED